MSRTKSLKASSFRFHDLIRKLKGKTSEEKKLLETDKKMVVADLAGNSAFETDKASIEVEVKTAILITDGQNDPDPSTLGNDDKLSTFEFTDLQYISLTRKLEKIAKKRKDSAKINLSDVSAADTVKECIDLVTAAIK